MATQYKLKPFTLNSGDLDFLLTQVNFRPLFDAQGNGVVNWNGTTAVYNSNGSVIDLSSYATPQDALNALGQGFPSVTAPIGIRDVTGLHNNLFGVHQAWGSVDVPFRRDIQAHFDKYLTAPGANYTTTVDTAGVHQSNVVDGTPRMISQIATTGGAKMLTEGDLGFAGPNAHHIVYNVPFLSDGATPNPAYTQSGDPNAANFDANAVEGKAIVSDYGLIGALGHIDFQNPGSGELFIGSENPGVAPSNSWFATFGQFFDHGLDLIGKGGQGTTVKITLDASDPLYGLSGPDGRPVTAITINRATVDPTSVNSKGPDYVNHTSPYIDQSQTYGSTDQITQLLRKWVSSDGLTDSDPNKTYHAGIEMFDGQSLAHTWTRRWPDGKTAEVKDTLPTLSELRNHVLNTHRDSLTWEDVANFRNRDEGGHLSSGVSGHALILDMNPRFDGTHLDSMQIVGSQTVDSLVDDAVAVLSTATPPGFSFGRTGVDGVSGGIQLVVSGGAGGPHLPDGTYTGANALALWVNFADFSIAAPAGAVHDAVGQILLASIGDHYIAGDGRVNENFGLTSIHHVFHEEHNYQVQNLMQSIYQQDTATSPVTHDELHKWQDDTGVVNAATGDYLNADGTVAWDTNKFFNATKLIVEMEYQHAAVDQYARTVTPRIQEFVGYSSGRDATVSLEYSQAAFRFGHSTIRETIDFMDPDHGLTGKIMGFALEQAFLNPQKYADLGPAGLTLGMMHQQMNEVDEFITPALNQGLLGQPLDLAAINIARNRDIGIPTLNDFRAALGLTKYANWEEFGNKMIHPDSLVNFIAAYSFNGDVAKAAAMVGLAGGTIAEGDAEALSYTLDQALAFMAHDTLALDVGGSAENAELLAASGGFDHIDTWLGGLAEEHVPGGLLGETFDLIFFNQIESLMDGDRFYYLYRLVGTNLHEEVNNGQFKDIVERNTGLEHLNGSIFAYADKYYELANTVDGTSTTGSYKTDHKYGGIVAAHSGDANGSDSSGDANVGIGIWSDGGKSVASMNTNGTIFTLNGTKFIRDFRPELNSSQVHTVEGTPTSGADSHEVIVASDYRDYIHGRAGDDTIYGEGGDDLIFGDAGIDRLYGGDGDDVIDTGEGPDLADGGAGDDTIYGFGSGSEVGGFDQLVGGSGNDVIWGGEGIDKLSGGSGDDRIYGEGNTDPFTHGGDGNDLIDGGTGGDILYGDAGDDLLIGGDDQDIVEGDTGDDILRPGNPSQALGGGPDEVLGGDGFTDTGFDLIDFSDRTKGATAGIIGNLANQANPVIAIDGTTPMPAMTQVEGFIGTQNNDILIGDNPAATADAGTDSGNNWLIGGSGDDVLQGNAGNDILIGDSIRLDALIGKYMRADANGALILDSNGGPIEDAYTSYINGASHHTAATSRLYGGLLETEGMADRRHFIEFLQSQMFKDFLLGDGGTDGVDTVSYVDATGSVNVNLTTGRATGADGNDLLVGIENIIGGAFDDVLTGDARGNVFTGGEGNDVINGGGGTDTAVYMQPFVDMNFSLNNSGAIIVSATTGVGGGNNGGDSLTSIEVLRFGADYTVMSGTNGANALVGTAGADAILGFNGDDSLTGGAGNDVINGGGGNDRIMATNNDGDDIYVGGNGIDTYDLSGTSAAATVNLTTGIATSTAIGRDTLFSIENVIGSSGANILLGNTGSNRLEGLGGNDTISGGGGGDILLGGAGNDSLTGGVGADILVGGQGADTIYIGAADTSRDIVRLTATADYGDQVFQFSNTGQAVQRDAVSFANNLRTTFDDVSGGGNQIIFATDAAAPQIASLTTVEGLYLSGNNGHGVTTAQLETAGNVAAAINNVFLVATTAANRDALVVINDTNGNDFAVWQFLETGALFGVQSSELTLIGHFHGNATVTAGQFIYE